MNDDKAALSEQGRILADKFFLERDKKLIADLHRIEKMKETKSVLSKVSGITDDDTLQKLIDLNIRPEILATLALVPLVEVAWADGKVDEKEIKAVLEAAEESFISKDSPDFDLLRQWLTHKPGTELLKAWEHYIKGLCRELTAHQKSALKKDILGHARQVAQSAGGILGFGKKISKAEQKILDKLDSAFA
jgi:uncharacterized tellurite resistance protein B-like protein